MKSFIKQVGIVSSGTALGALLPIVSMPWLARIYSPHEFGEYALFYTSVSVLLPVSCLRYDLTIVSASDEDFQIAVHTAITGSILAASTACIIGMLCSSFLDSITIPLVTILSFIVIFLGWIQTANSVTLHDKNFISNSILKLLPPLCFVLLSGLSQSIGLINAYIAGLAVTAAYVYFTGIVTIRQRMNFRKIRIWAVKKKDFLMSSGTALLDNLSMAAPTYIIASVFGNEITGTYSQVQRLIAAPMLLLAMAVGNVFFSRAGELYRNNKPTFPLFKTVAIVMAAGSSIMLLISYFWGEQLLHHILGDKWKVDSQLIPLIVLPALIRVCVSPLSTILIVANRIKFIAMWQIIYFISEYSVLILATLYLDFRYFLVVLSLNELFFYGLYFYICQRVATR